MGTAASRQPGEGPVTWEQFVALPDDDRRELVDGYLEETEMPSQLHEYIVMMLGYYLVAWTKTTKAGGRVLASGYKVRVSAKRGVMPDVQYFRKGTPTQPVALEEGRPDLAVEVVSPGRGGFDRIRKLDWYGSIGVPEYWIVDPEEQSLTRYVRGEGEWRVRDALEGDAVFCPDSFPGLEIALAELWTLPE